MSRVIITVEVISIEAQLYETETAAAIERLLPFGGTASLWGEELYFYIPLSHGLEADAREEVEPGELGYWPQGPAFCIFFGRTPASTSEKPRAYSPVNVFGRVLGNTTVLKSVPSGACVRVSRG